MDQQIYLRRQASTMRNLARETADSEMVALLFRLAAAYDDAATRAEHVPNAYFERAASAAT